MASIEIGNYKIEHNLKTGRYDLYKKGVGFIISCISPTACKQVVDSLNKNEGKEEEVIDKAILDELKRLNEKPEYRPVNRSSILNSDIAKMTRELMSKYK